MCVLLDPYATIRVFMLLNTYVCNMYVHTYDTNDSNI